MSLFGTSPQDESPSLGNSTMGKSRGSLFDDDNPMTRSTSDTLFDDDAGDNTDSSPWDMPTPRKQRTRADLLNGLLASAPIPDNYIEVFDDALSDDGAAGKVVSSGVTKTLASAKLSADNQARIMSILAPNGDAIALGRNEFNVLLALIGLAQEGEAVSLDGVDERRHDLPVPQLSLTGASKKQPKVALPNTADLAAKPPQQPETPRQKPRARQPSMDNPEHDPWNTPDVHKGHNHAANLKAPNGDHSSMNGHGFNAGDQPDMHSRTTSNFTTSTIGSPGGQAPASSGSGASNAGGGWNYFEGNNPTGGFGDGASDQPTSPFGAGGSGGAGGGDGGRTPGSNAPGSQSQTLGSGRTGNSVSENITVTLMPEKEGMFMFQHHNYEVMSIRRASKVIRRYSDFVWLLDCLHKRYPFRVLPLLPPKRVAVNGNHLSNDGAFIEKRRRGLARFLNSIMKHPILGQEQLVIMFLTVPTELAVWRKQAAISVVDEFSGRALPPGLEDSLPPTLNELFDQTRQGVRRSAELYISLCSIMDRLVKRSEGVAADHARLAMSLASLTETSSDTYATDTNEVPLLNDGLASMSRHLRTTQGLMEDESKAWDVGVLEDLKKQRDVLVSVREMFDRRERLDKDNIPYLERRIQTNETKLAGLRSKPDGMVKPGEIEKVVEAIIKDKESIVNQHNRSVFVKETIRDELVNFQQTQYHVSRWNQDWAQERVKYSEMLADNWRRLLDELDGMPLGEYEEEEVEEAFKLRYPSVLLLLIVIGSVVFLEGVLGVQPSWKMGELDIFIPSILGQIQQDKGWYTFGPARPISVTPCLPSRNRQASAGGEPVFAQPLCTTTVSTVFGSYQGDIFFSTLDPIQHTFLIFIPGTPASLVTMPPLTRDQRAAISSFVQVTGVTDRVAQRFMKDSGYRLNDAVEAYFQNKSGSSENLEAPLNKLFDSLRTDDDEKDKLGVESSMGYLVSLGADVENASSFLAMNIINTQSFGETERSNFVKGWSEAGCEPKHEAHKAYFKDLLKRLSSDKDLFKKVYRSMFDLGKEPDQRALSLESALAYWTALFQSPGWPWTSSNVDWLEEWKAFLGEKWTRSVSRDMWNQTLEFAWKSMGDDTLSFWSEDGAWPGVIDDFVAWYRAKSAMDVDA